MTVDDIEAVLDHRDLRGIEAVFRRLVQWPGDDAVADAEDAADLAMLLDRITAALEADRTPMPPDLVDGLIRDVGGGGWLRDDRSYAAGARAVAAARHRWTRVFTERLDCAGEGPVPDGAA